MSRIRYSLWLLSFPILFIRCNHSSACRFEGVIIDELTGNPLSARVYAIKDDSVYMAARCVPFEIQSWLKKIVGHSGRYFNTVGNTFEITFSSEGPITIIIERGKEYRTINKKFILKKRENNIDTFKLQRWIDMNKRGWFSADHHVHRDINQLIYLLPSEDINIALVQSDWNEEKRFMQMADSALHHCDENGVLVIDSLHMASIISHEIEGKHGALLYHLLQKSQFPLPNVRNTEELNNYLALCKQTKQLGGYTELEKPIYTDAHIFALLSDIDFMEIANNHNLYYRYLPEFSGQLNRSVLNKNYPVGQLGYTLFVFDLYYNYLNLGQHVIPTAGSASYPVPNPFGYNRVYVKINKPLNIENYFSALISGKCFVTNGPMIMLSVDGKEMGDTLYIDSSNLHVSCSLYYPQSLTSVEWIYNGNVVKRWENITMRNDSTVINDIIRVKESGWLVARCFEQLDNHNIRFAHTAPVYVTYKNNSFKPNADSKAFFKRITQDLITKVRQNDTSFEKASLLKCYANALRRVNEIK